MLRVEITRYLSMESSVQALGQVQLLQGSCSREIRQHEFHRSGRNTTCIVTASKCREPKLAKRNSLCLCWQMSLFLLPDTDVSSSSNHISRNLGKDATQNVYISGKTINAILSQKLLQFYFLPQTPSAFLQATSTAFPPVCHSPHSSSQVKKGYGFETNCSRASSAGRNDNRGRRWRANSMQTALLRF
jgi:hypothetical protein